MRSAWTEQELQRLRTWLRGQPHLSYRQLADKAVEEGVCQGRSAGAIKSRIFELVKEAEGTKQALDEQASQQQASVPSYSRPEARTVNRDVLEAIISHLHRAKRTDRHTNTLALIRHLDEEIDRLEEQQRMLQVMRDLLHAFADKEPLPMRR